MRENVRCLKIDAPRCGRLLVAVAVVTMLFGCAGSTHTPDAQGVRPETLTPKDWIALGKPSAPHLLLKNFVGAWDVAISTVAAPGEAPDISAGASQSSLILGARFVRERFRGTVGGSAFEGLGFLGYDAGSKKFVSSWMDSLSTVIAQSEGKYDERSKTIELIGEIYDPLEGRKKRTVTQIHLTSPDQYEVKTISTTDRGVSFTALEMVYRRRLSVLRRDNRQKP